MKNLTVGILLIHLLGGLYSSSLTASKIATKKSTTPPHVLQLFHQMNPEERRDYQHRFLSNDQIESFGEDYLAWIEQQGGQNKKSHQTGNKQNKKEIAKESKEALIQKAVLDAISVHLLPNEQDGIIAETENSTQIRTIVKNNGDKTTISINQIGCLRQPNNTNTNTSGYYALFNAIMLKICDCENRSEIATLEALSDRNDRFTDQLTTLLQHTADIVVTKGIEMGGAEMNAFAVGCLFLPNIMTDVFKKNSSKISPHAGTDILKSLCRVIQAEAIEIDPAIGNKTCSITISEQIYNFHAIGMKNEKRFMVSTLKNLHWIAIKLEKDSRGNTTATICDSNGTQFKLT